MKTDFEVGKGFEKLFKFKSKKEEINHRARIIGYRFLSEVEKWMDETNTNQTLLAKKLGTSKSYLTQLFQGDKMPNMKLLARLEMIMKSRFEVKSISGNKPNK